MAVFFTERDSFLSYTPLVGYTGYVGIPGTIPVDSLLGTTIPTNYLTIRDSVNADIFTVDDDRIVFDRPVVFNHPVTYSMQVTYNVPPINNFAQGPINDD